jgi:hypothetical protein
MNLKPEFGLSPKRRRPVTSEEEMAMRFISVQAQRAYRIRGEKLKTISGSQLAQHCQPKGKTMPWKRPLLPNYIGPLDWSNFKSEKIICIGCKRT